MESLLPLKGTSHLDSSMSENLKKELKIC